MRDSAKLPRTRRDAQAVQTRERLLAAALAVFGERGIAVDEAPWLAPLGIEGVNPGEGVAEVGSDTAAGVAALVAWLFDGAMLLVTC